MDHTNNIIKIEKLLIIYNYIDNNRNGEYTKYSEDDVLLSHKIYYFIKKYFLFIDIYC